jgi:hypothetical protein
MQAKDAIKTALQSTQNLLEMYVADLSDADLKHRPVPKANTAAWQIAHLIEAEAMIGSEIPGSKYPELPAKMKMPKDGSDPAGGYPKKAELLEQFKMVRAATLHALERLSDADLDKPTSGDMAKWAPTLGALLILTSNHVLMHVGQFTVVRRALNKPVLF